MRRRGLQRIYWKIWKMIKLIWGSSFSRAYKKKVKTDSQVKEKFRKLIKIFEKDPFNPLLKTHKLSGTLSGHWAFVVEYDCRVVFRFEGKNEVLLVDIGSHDEVY